MKQSLAISIVAVMLFVLPFNAALASDEAKEVFPLTDAEYKMYNDVMEFLCRDFDTPEEKLLESIAPDYGMSGPELKEFMTYAMDYVIKKDQGYYANADHMTQSLVSFSKEAISEVNGGRIEVSADLDDWDVSGVFPRFIIKTVMTIDGKSVDVIAKIEVQDDEYAECEMFQLKLDGVNIDLD